MRLTLCQARAVCTVTFNPHSKAPFIDEETETRHEVLSVMPGTELQLGLNSDPHGNSVGPTSALWSDAHPGCPVLCGFPPCHGSQLYESPLAWGLPAIPSATCCCDPSAHS